VAGQGKVSGGLYFAPPPPRQLEKKKSWRNLGGLADEPYEFGIIKRGLEMAPWVFCFLVDICRLIVFV